ncbi:MAG: sarcosine oxidase subunit delta [Hyphomicrobiales bacterium]|nr:sarcosine oxidase subunit delta [Hyphomicrobiales bacterium]PCJ82462.1 MAG: sarcosine oxidase subunit delta [Hyphomicrobiales bacterium]
MIINCPHCGPRDVSEFTYLGDASVKRPTSEKAARKSWENLVYNRDNPLGKHRELWHHAFACRLTMEVVRNTKTHEITSVKGRGPYFEETSK